MLDGLYQSVMCFFITYLVFSPATFVTTSGRNIDDPERMGVNVGCAAIVVVNVYILLNTYRWDWIMLLVTFVSILLIWFWTGIFSLFSSAARDFYKAAGQVFGQPTFWAVLLLTVIICLLPRFTAKSFQKIFRPRDVDIIREQIKKGEFKYLDEKDDGNSSPAKAPSRSSSDLSKPAKPGHAPTLAEDETPLYPPSVAPTSTTHNPRSQNGSDGTDYVGNRDSFERPPQPPMDRPRPSYDRIRSSMDRVRPSFEASNDFTSAAMLSRMESSQCIIPSYHSPEVKGNPR